MSRTKKEVPSAEQIHRERYRMIEMNNIISSLSATCFGRDQSIRPFIVTEKGKFSSQKAQKLADELVELMRECNGILRGLQFTDEQLNLIRSIALLSILIPGTYYEYPLEKDPEGNFPKELSWHISFEDLNDFYKCTYPPCSEADYPNLIKYITPADHALGLIKYLQEILNMKEDTNGSAEADGTGTGIYIRYTHDSKHIADEDLEWADYEEDPEYDAYLSEMAKKMEEEEKNNPEQQNAIDQMIQEAVAMDEAYTNIFPMQKKFEEACRTYRNLVFKCYPEDFETIAEMALNLFLIRHDLSPLSEQEEYWRVHTECAVAKRRVIKNRP